MITLKQIRYFIGAAEVGQVSAAAHNLNVSQSAVTLSIKDLEAELGVTLFTRRSTGLELTQEGQHFLNHAKRIESSVSDALTSMRTSSSRVKGHIRLGLTYTLSGYFIFPVLSRLRRTHPGITFELIERHRPELESLIREGGVDVALLLTSNLADRRRIASETLVKSPRRLWVSSAHPLVRAKRITMEDISREPFVMFHADEADESARRYWAEAKEKPNVVFRTGALEAVRSMVANNLAVTILSDLVYRPWSLDGNRIEKREVNSRLPTMDMGLAWKRGKAFSEPEQRLREHLRSAITQL